MNNVSAFLSDFFASEKNSTPIKSQNLREMVYFYLLPSQVTYLPGAIVPVITKAGLLGRSLALHAANMKLYTLGFGREVSA